MSPHPRPLAHNYSLQMNAIIKPSYKSVATHVTSRSRVPVRAVRGSGGFAFDSTTPNQSSKPKDCCVSPSLEASRNQAASTSSNKMNSASLAPQLVLGLALMALGTAGPSIAQDLDLASTHQHITPALGDLGATEEFFSNIVSLLLPPFMFVSYSVFNI